MMQLRHTSSSDVAWLLTLVTGLRSRVHKLAEDERRQSWRALEVSDLRSPSYPVIHLARHICTAICRTHRETRSLPDSRANCLRRKSCREWQVKPTVRMSAISRKKQRKLTTFETRTRSAVNRRETARRSVLLINVVKRSKRQKVPSVTLQKLYTFSLKGAENGTKNWRKIRPLGKMALNSDYG